MEVVLDSSEGVPEGGVLSIKFGDTKRQAPVAKVGQPFRFPGSPADPLPLKVELLVPVAPPKTVEFDAAVEKFTVDFGNGVKVNLSQRECASLARPPVDIGSEAEARGLQAEKLAMAKTAAGYLEEHGLVQMFQDILHGLLIAKPSDPHSYVEERMARARKLAAKRDKSECGADVDTMSMRSSATGRKKGPSVREMVRERSEAGKEAKESYSNKVETLMTTLQNTHDQLPLVLPFLPNELRHDLASQELAEECKRQFQALDTKGTGTLTPKDMLPVIVRLSQARTSAITDEAIQRFVEMFDANEDGVICQSEFTTLVQFVIVAGFLESEEGTATIELATIEEQSFQDFIRMVEVDKERLWSIIPFLPTWLMEHVTSNEFHTNCNKNFDELDSNQSGALEPAELLSVISQLSEAHPMSIDVEKCKRFTKIFDTAGNGVITREEFVEFAQFLTVMNYLAGSAEGQQIKQLSDADLAGAKTLKLIGIMEQTGEVSKQVLAGLPKALVAEINSKVFMDACKMGFVREATRGGTAEKPSLSPQELYPVICDLCKAHPFDVIREQYGDFVEIYCKARPQGLSELKAEVAGVQDKKAGSLVETMNAVTKDKFPDLARFVIILAYLHYTKEHQDLLMADVLLGQEKVSQLLKSLRDGVDKIAELAPFLPQDLVDEILSDSFANKCREDFMSLDKDNSGVLEPGELMPIILHLSEAHRLALTEDHCKHFVDIFDVERNGVITQAEFVNFARFMMIMAFMDTEEGIAVEVDAEVAKQGESVEELLKMLEEDRSAVHKVIPLLPKDVYDNMTSDEFVMNCHQRFVELDKDKTGVLRPWELFPVVVDLSAASPCAVTQDQCKRFTAIFDIHGDGVLRLDEFLDFTRFLCIMSYLHTDEGKDAAMGALQIMAESKQIEELLTTLEQDKRELNKVIPFLPDWLRDDILSDHFTVECLTFFNELDKDRSGTLEPEELYPMVLALSEAQEASLDMEQCRHFTSIFDDEKTGVISKSEFVNFARFLIIMGHLKSHQDVPSLMGKAAMLSQSMPQGPTPSSALKSLKKSDTETTQLPSTMPVRQLAPATEVSTSALQRTHLESRLLNEWQSPLAASKMASSLVPTSPNAASGVEHLAVDCEYYQNKSDKLSAENETLRERLHSLEQLVRSMEGRLEDQGHRLRHAEVDLRATGALQ